MYTRNERRAQAPGFVRRRFDRLDWLDRTADHIRTVVLDDGQDLTIDVPTELYDNLSNARQTLKQACLTRGVDISRIRFHQSRPRRQIYVIPRDG